MKHFEFGIDRSFVQLVINNNIDFDDIENGMSFYKNKFLTENNVFVLIAEFVRFLVIVKSFGAKINKTEDINVFCKNLLAPLIRWVEVSEFL